MIKAKYLTKVTDLNKVLLEDVISEGDIVIDATMGNGYDTKYLAEKKNGGNVTYHGYSELVEKEQPIDFIFVNGFASKVSSYTVDSEKLNGIYPSDHHPVISEITF